MLRLPQVCNNTLHMFSELTAAELASICWSLLLLPKVTALQTTEPDSWIVHYRADELLEIMMPESSDSGHCNANLSIMQFAQACLHICLQ